MELKITESTQLTVKSVSRKYAKQLIVLHHYAHAWSSCKHAIGLYKAGSVVGVAIYGSPVGRLTAQSIAPIVKDNEVLELTRLWVNDSEGKNTESWFLGQTFKWLKKNDPKIKVLISYTDPTVGHIGTIYQATNWLYQGNEIRFTEYFMYKIKGVTHHPRTVFSKYGTNDLEKLKKVEPDIEIIPTERKHRYIYILTPKRERKKILKAIKRPIKPYDKITRNKSDDQLTNKLDSAFTKKDKQKKFFGE